MINMDGKQHFGVAIFVVVILSVLLHNFASLTDKETLVFLFSIVFFSSILTPDIDLKLPLIKHRGITHNALYIAVMAVVLWLTTNLTLVFIGQSSATAFTLLFWSGFVLGWYVHLVTDAIYDRIREVFWVILIIVLGAVFWLVK